jgi:soluble lytic murein transglycosylase
MQRNGLVVLVVLVVSILAMSFIGRRGEGLARPEPTVSTAEPPAEGEWWDVPGVPESVATFLSNGQSWRAAREMRRHLAAHPSARPEVVLVAARAEAGWGGWSHVRDYLRGKPWLDEAWGGEGWYWLGRALEAGDDRAGALDAYARYLRASREPAARDRRLVAQLREGLILLGTKGRAEDGAKQLAQVRAHAREIGPRLDVLAAEALAAGGDTPGDRRLTESAGTDAALPRRSRAALLAAYQQSGDRPAARRVALALRESAASDAERAGYELAAAKLAAALGDRAAERTGLLAALRLSPGSGAGGEAAERLEKLGSLSTAERLQVARALDRHGRNAAAAEGYRAWLAAGAGSAAERDEVRLDLGDALFDAGRFADAVSAVTPLAERSGSLGARALYLIGRAEMRRDNDSKARATFLRLAERHPGSEIASEGLFLVGDAAHDREDVDAARSVYRRVATGFPGTDRAGLSLMRLGGLAFRARDYAGAARVWEEYRSSYPRGERWLESTYWAGRSYQQLGDTARARARFRAVREREPLSYYSLLAARRLGVPYWPVPMGTAPGMDREAAERVKGWVRWVDLLTEAGLDAEAEAEAARTVDRAGTDPTLLYPLAEALNEHGYTARGITAGYRLRDRAGALNPRILRIIYPFPYREMISAEAKERGLDPFLVAALIRQESSFKANVSSGPGARGLMQIMPETGRALARAAGIDGWSTALLYQPEINAHLGTRFLADQMKQYDGELPAVFAAYNAGPGRVDVWEHFPEARDAELFTERLPSRETRDYVKILTRNIAIYRGLYGR